MHSTNARCQCTAISPWSAAASFGTGPGTIWSGATPVWSGAPTAWTDYTFQRSFVINATYAGVTFRAQNTSNYYLWQFKSNGENTIALCPGSVRRAASPKSGGLPEQGARGEPAAWFRDSEGNLLGVGEPVV